MDSLFWRASPYWLPRGYLLKDDVWRFICIPDSEKFDNFPENQAQVMFASNFNQFISFVVAAIVCIFNAKLLIMIKDFLLGREIRSFGTKCIYISGNKVTSYKGCCYLTIPLNPKLIYAQSLNRWHVLGYKYNKNINRFVLDSDLVHPCQESERRRRQLSWCHQLFSA